MKDTGTSKPQKYVNMIKKGEDFEIMTNFCFTYSIVCSYIKSASHCINHSVFQ